MCLLYHLKKTVPLLYEIMKGNIQEDAIESYTSRWATQAAWTAHWLVYLSIEISMYVYIKHFCTKYTIKCIPLLRG
jgi:hypothetical protein